MDAINYNPQRDGAIPGLDDLSLSSSQVLQRHLGSAHVVKVFIGREVRSGPCAGAKMSVQ
jgi:hypothetical protein